MKILPQLRSRGSLNDDWKQSSAAFILSTGRVGTVSLIRLLNLSPHISAHHEPEPKRLKLMVQTFTQFDKAPQRFADLFIQARCRLIQLAHAQGRTFVEATQLKYLAPVIADQMPSARFIHIYRHPGGVIRSAMRRGWYDNHPLDRYRPRPSRGDPMHPAWGDLSPFEKNCWLWNEDNRRFLDLAERIGQLRVMRVAYEYLFNGSNDCALELFRFLEVEPPDVQAIRHSLSQRRNAQEGPDFPRYDQWNSAMRQTLDALAGQTMLRLGYERPTLPTNENTSAYSVKGTSHATDAA